MKTLKSMSLAVLISAAAIPYWVTPTLAERLPPKAVKPVVKDGIEYSAPPNRMGFVVATWTKTKREIWSRQVYVIKYEYKLGLEEDVQRCFITDLRFENGKLRANNERGGEFEIDPDSLAVRVLKGAAVIDHTNWEPRK